jgi:hypothetical protein
VGLGLNYLVTIPFVISSDICTGIHRHASHDTSAMHILPDVTRFFVNAPHAYAYFHLSIDKQHTP